MLRVLLGVFLGGFGGLGGCVLGLGGLGMRCLVLGGGSGGGVGWGGGRWRVGGGSPHRTGNHLVPVLDLWACCSQTCRHSTR